MARFGTPNDHHETSKFVKIIEERTGKKIGMLEEIAFNMKFIDKKKMISLAKKNPILEDKEYLFKNFKKISLNYVPIKIFCS